MDFTEAYPDRCSTVGSAVRTGDTDALKELIRRGASINVHDNRGWMPLHEAAFANQYECVKILLGKASEEDVNARTWEGETPLFFAAKNGHQKILRQLIKSGANPNICNNEEGSPILQAVAGNHKDCVALLLMKGANVNSQLCTGWSLLHEAACQGYSDVLLQLLQAGAKTDIRDDFGIMPVFTAAQYGHLDCLKILIECGSDPNARAEDNATPLYLAAQEGHSGCVEYLLAHGASVDIPTNTEEGFRPIHVAAFKGHIRCLELLIPPSLVRLETSLYSAESVTPLHLAAMGGHDRAIEMLLQAGCDPDCGIRNPSKHLKESLLEALQQSLDSVPPFYCATKRGHYEAAKLLLDAGACICHPSRNYCLLTKSMSDTRALRLLLDHGTDAACQHVVSHLPQLLCASIQYLRCLLDRGLRFHFSCRTGQGICPKVYGRYQMSTSRLMEVIKLTHRYIDRLNMCKHNIRFLQKKGCYDEIVSLSKPHPLLHLCRVAITEHLGTSRALAIIPKMDFLPRLLKDYLLYKDISDRDDSDL